MLFHRVPPCPPLISGSCNDKRDKPQLFYATNDTSLFDHVTTKQFMTLTPKHQTVMLVLSLDLPKAHVLEYKSGTQTGFLQAGPQDERAQACTSRMAEKVCML